MSNNDSISPSILALGLLFLILGYTNDHDILMIVGLLFGIVGLNNTLPQIKKNMNIYKDKDSEK